jgi:serine/threonine protein phosphatase PrpC
MVSDRELESDIDGTLLDETCEALLARVLSRGARDNVTFILVSCFPNEALLPPL